MALISQRTIPVDKFKSYFEQAKTSTYRGWYPSHSQPQDIRCASWNNCGSRFAFVQGDRTIRVQQNGKPDSKSGLEIRQAHLVPIEDISWTPLNSDVLVSCGSDGIKLWDVRTKTVLNKRSLSSENTQGHAIICRYSYDGLSIAVCTKDGWLLILDGQSLEVKASYKDQHLIDIDWSNDSKYIAISQDNGRVNLVHVESEITSILSLNGPEAAATCVQFDPRGQVLAVGSRDGVVSLWSLDSWMCIRTFSKVDASIKSISFSHDGEYLAIAYEMQAPIDIVSTNSGDYVYQVPKSFNFSAWASVRWHPLRYQLLYMGEEGGLNVLNRL